MKTLFNAERQILFSNNSIQEPQPILINFINCAIQMIYSQMQASKLKQNTTQFFKIFLNFAKLGEETTKYLVDKQFIARALDAFYDQDKLKQFLDLPYQDIQTNLIGYQNTKKKKIVSILDEYWSKQKNQHFTAPTIPTDFGTNSKYLWQTLFILINSPETTLTNSEKALLMAPNNYIISTLDKSNESKQFMRAYVGILGILATNNQKFTKQLIDLVFSILTTKNVGDWRPVFHLIKKQCEIEDSIEKPRIDRLIKKVLEALRQNQSNDQYACDADILQQFILKLATRNNSVYQWFTSNTSQLGFILEWINFNQIASKNYLLIDDVLMHNSFTRPKTGKSAKKHCLKKFQQFQALVKKQQLEDINDFDSDEDQGNFDFMVGQKIDYYHKNLQNWIPAEINKICEDLLQIKYENKNNMIFLWINKDSENIMLENQMISNEEYERDTYQESSESNESSDYNLSLIHI
eukprot:TRINITY_DN2620_c0_g1_i1.p2 TRINITY_DN2620_c0_g1~~TRINITY_DN2620_c0_g1_i1.p2  ORF type:complete len:465 (-),score=85.41 TRINITY_DN2620_c0_g1_i1:144-1538(-)